MITFDNITQPIEDWALDYGIPAALIKSRLKEGWSVERAITEPMPAAPGAKLKTNAFVVKKRNRIHSGAVNKRERGRGRPGRTITFNGETLTVSQWAKRIGISRVSLYARLKLGWTVERALGEPINEKHGPVPKSIELNGESLTMNQWAKRLNLSPTTLHCRLNSRLWTLEKALTTRNARGYRSGGLKMTRPRGVGRSLEQSSGDRRGSSLRGSRKLDIF